LDKEDLFVLQIKSEIGVESWDDNTQKTSKIGRLARHLIEVGKPTPTFKTFYMSYGFFECLLGFSI